MQEYRNSGGADKSVFVKDFYDCILHKGRSLDTIYRYIRENPYRLAVRRAHPEYFRRVNDLEINGRIYQGHGNFQLLDNPFIEQVVLHRADAEPLSEQNRERWLYVAVNGGVLVSPFISQDEKVVRAEAEALGGRVVLIVSEPLTERYKPTGHDFDLCNAGRLLILSTNLPGGVYRCVCQAMNSLAEVISAGK